MIKNPGANSFVIDKVSGQEGVTVQNGTTLAANSISAPSHDSSVVHAGVTYTFDGWYANNSGCIGSKVDPTSYVINEATTFYARYVPGTAIPYSITYAGLEGATVNPANPASYTVQSGAITLNNPTKPGYTFTGWTGSNGTTPSTNVTIPAGSTGNKSYTANFAEDADVTITYTVNNADAGEVSSTSQTLAPATGTAVGSTASAKTGYHFVNWTDAEGNVVSNELAFVPQKVDGLNVAAAYTANFAKRTDLSYTIRYIDEDTGAAVRDAVTVENQTFEAVIDVNGIEKPSIDGYAFTTANRPSLTIGVDVEENVIILYYAEDVIGTDPENPDQDGDGIPDKYQITVSYVVNRGSAAFSSKVLTKLGADGKPSVDGTVVLGRTDIPAVQPEQEDYLDFGWNVGNLLGMTLTSDSTFYYTFEAPSEGDEDLEIEDPETPLAGPNGLNDVDHFAYIIGYENDTVRPLDNITRAEVATIYLRLMTEVSRIINWSTVNDYSDVNVGDWHNNAISTTTRAGIVFGYGDGSYKPNQYITRAEFAAFAANVLGAEYTGEEIEDFADTANHAYAVAIRRCVEAGWIVREDDNLFRPDEYITRAEAIVIFNRMLNRLPDEEHMLPDMKTWVDNPAGTWYYEAVQEATNEHEYVRDEETLESWIELRPATDWKALEEQWAAEYGASAETGEE